MSIPDVTTEQPAKAAPAEKKADDFGDDLPF
jgi:hypothetical protein